MTSRNGKQARKTSAKSPRGAELVPQPHGGALQRGNPGNVGGGRPRSEVVRQARELSPKALAYCERVLDGKERDASVGEKLRAADTVIRTAIQDGRIGAAELLSLLDDLRPVLDSIPEPHRTTAVERMTEVMRKWEERLK